MPETWVVVNLTTVWVVVECLLFWAVISLLILPPEDNDARTTMEAHASLDTLLFCAFMQGLLTAAVAGVAYIWADLAFWDVVTLPVLGTLAAFTVATPCYAGVFAEVNMTTRGGSVRYRGGVVGKVMTRVVPILTAAGAVLVVAVGIRAILNNEVDWS